MPAGPQAWRRWRRVTPQNAKPNCANDPKGYGYRTPPPPRRPRQRRNNARSSQLDDEIIFLCEDDEDDANEASPTIQFILPKGDTNEA